MYAEYTYEFPRTICTAFEYGTFSINLRTLKGKDVHVGREISAIIVTDDYYLCYKEPKSSYKFSYFNI